MKRVAIIFALALGLLVLAAWSYFHFARRTYVTSEVIDGEQKTLFHAISEELRFARKGINSKGEYRRQTILFKIRTHTAWCPGMDGLTSHMQVTALIVDPKGRPQRLLWVIRQDGHEFWDQPDHDHVQILERACCDGQARLTTYDAFTGDFVESHDYRPK